MGREREGVGGAERERWVGRVKRVDGWEREGWAGRVKQVDGWGEGGVGRESEASGWVRRERGGQGEGGEWWVGSERLVEESFRLAYKSIEGSSSLCLKFVSACTLWDGAPYFVYEVCVFSDCDICTHSVMICPSSCLLSHPLPCPLPHPTGLPRRPRS